MPQRLGFNFMEFFAKNKVIVNPLRIKDNYLSELQHNILLLYTGTSRKSAVIIDEQKKSVNNDQNAIDAMIRVKEQSYLFKEALLKGELGKIGEILDQGWQYKKNTSSSITNLEIDNYVRIAQENGATGGKISGAGGGGFMIFYCPATTRFKVLESMLKIGCEFRRFQFVKKGVQTWIAQI